MVRLDSRESVACLCYCMEKWDWHSWKELLVSHVAIEIVRLDSRKEFVCLVVINLYSLYGYRYPYPTTSSYPSNIVRDIIPKTESYPIMPCAVVYFRDCYYSTVLAYDDIRPCQHHHVYCAQFMAEYNNNLSRFSLCMLPLRKRIISFWFYYIVLNIILHPILASYTNPRAFLKYWLTAYLIMPPQALFVTAYAGATSRRNVTLLTSQSKQNKRVLNQPKQLLFHRSLQWFSRLMQWINRHEFVR